MGGVQPRVTVLRRVWRMLSEKDRPRYADLFAPYPKGHAGRSIHLRHLGEVMRCPRTELEAIYGDQPIYHVLTWVRAEHFRPEPVEDCRSRRLAN